MDGTSAKKSASFETLVIQNITNVNELKDKLYEIISVGKNYEYDVSSCLKSLINNNDQTIVLLCVQAISELAKCEIKREIYATKDIILPIMNILSKEINSDSIELVKQCCRALGNLCCDCDASRIIILENNGVLVLANVLESALKNDTLEEIRLLASKTLLNYAIGGHQFSESIVEEGVIDKQNKILLSEMEKDDMNDDSVVTALLILSVINDNAPEFLFDSDVNKTVLNILKDTTNIEVSELCLEHLHMQAEHDLVKTLLANENGVQLVCSRLEQLMQKHEAGDLNAEDSEVEAVMKQACDLIIIVLTGDEAMDTLYNNGVGEVYLTMVKWLDYTNYNLLTTAVLAIGNFARKDEYCIHMMEDKIFDKLLDIFEVYHGFCLRIQKEQNTVHPIDIVTVNKIQHAALSAIRNLTVPVVNKRVAAAKGRATPMLLKALPNIEDHQVAYKLLAALRMLVDGQEGVARQLITDAAALGAVGRWARAGHAGAGGEAPRLLARALRQLPAAGRVRLLQVRAGERGRGGKAPCLLARTLCQLPVAERVRLLQVRAGERMRRGEAPRLLACALCQLPAAELMHMLQVHEGGRGRDAASARARTAPAARRRACAPVAVACGGENAQGDAGGENAQGRGAALARVRAVPAARRRAYAHAAGVVKALDFVERSSPSLAWVEGCVSSLVGMLVSSHSVMQNEAILALTLMAIESLHKKEESDFDCEQSFVTQMIKSEIGKHLSVLIETNCAKMPVEVAENLIAFLEITCKNNQLASDYKETKVQDALQKFVDTRKDFSEDLRSCVNKVLTAITDHSSA
ncbi:unnamed protein product [Parnassius apollo]|uniref:(apollo) hypothetical protein n=1 Tax=Parnassius apollo TaxID=110799 RepID=A0A8S3XYM2_PARAO|nr:unnamed protein product [Parnassius apollo]